jgi:serine/threonine-protein kinase
MRRIGEYRILSALAQTRFAVVHAAEHVTLGHPVALRLLAPAAGHAARPFMHEARVLDRLRHPAIPRILDCGYHDGSPWFATDRFPGRTLAQVIADGARIDVAGVLRDLSAILLHAEGRGFLLRGLTAERVTCVGNSRGVALCITDWHGARAVADAPADHAGSVHALGVIAFQTLTGVMAHAPSTIATLAGVDSVGAYVTRTPARVTWLVDRMLSRDPRDRPTLAEIHAQASSILAAAVTERFEDLTDDIERIDLAL